LVRKALFVRRFFMLNMFPHVESPRRPDHPCESYRADLPPSTR
jgi:hypothetical protein